MVDCVLGYDPLCLVVVIPSSVQVAVETGKVAARYFHTYSVSRSKVIARSVDIDRTFVYLSRLHPDFLRKSFTIPGTRYPLLHVESSSIRENIHQQPEGSLP